MESINTIEKYIEFKKINNRSKKGILSPKTQKLYQMNLGYLAKQLNGKTFKQTSENDIMDVLKDLKPRTKNSRIVIYRDFFKWLFDIDDYQPLPECIRRIKPVKIGIDDIKYRERVITEEEYDKLLKYAEKPLYKAILEALWVSGGRAVATQSIRSDGVWYDGEYTHIVLHQSKTDTREIIHPDRAEHLLLWAEDLQPFKGESGKPLFAVRKKGHGKYHKDSEEYAKINDQYTGNFLRRLCEKIGIRHLKPHDFRHTFITNMLKNNTPETHLKTLAGFSKSTDMLKVYDHNKLKDYKEWLKDRKAESKPTYQLLEKQKKTLEEKHEKEIDSLKEQVDIMNKALKDITEGMGEELEERIRHKEAYNEYQRTIHPSEKRPLPDQIKKEIDDAGEMKNWSEKKLANHKKINRRRG